MADLTPTLINLDFISRIVKNIDYNRTMIRYLNMYSAEFKGVDAVKRLKLKDEAIEMYECNRYYDLDYFKKSNIKDYKRTYRCKGRFCSNCKKVKQANRMKKFIPELVKYDSNLYHVVLTVPNCRGEDLKETIKKMNAAFKMLVRLLDGSKKIKGIDLSFFNYKGCFRSLEVSYKAPGIDRRYHPHFHCCFVFEGYTESTKYIENRYSVDHYGNRDVQLFSRENVLLQKLWFMCYNGSRMVKESIYYAEIDKKDYKGDKKKVKNVGYSVMMKKVDEGSYQEFFKYMIKDFSVDKSKDGKQIKMDYDVFKVFYEQLKGVRQIECYGCLYGIKDQDIVSDEMVDIVYDDIRGELLAVELPVDIKEEPYEIKAHIENNDCVYISRKKVYSYLKRVMLESIDDGKSNNIVVDNSKYYKMAKEIIDFCLVEKDN